MYFNVMSENAVNVSDYGWLTGTFVQCAKEFIAVWFQLVAYSRLGAFDFFNGSLVLYVTLVVFNFPILNSYLFSVMRFGPWGGNNFTWFSWNKSYWIVQTLLITLSQGVGAFVAAKCTNKFKDNWPNLKVTSSNGTDFGFTYTDIDDELSKSDSVSNHFYLVLEEFFAVLILLIGLIHLIHAEQGGLLHNAYGSEVIEKSSEKAPFVASEIAETDIVNVKHKPSPIPIQLIFFASILVAGITRAFPSAHQAFHISVYLGVTNVYSLKTVIFRIIGGVLATLVSILYYNWMYIWIGTPSQKKMYSTLIDPKNCAMFNSELTLPDSMSQIKRSF